MKYTPGKCPGFIGQFVVESHLQKGFILAIEARDFGFGTLHASGGILVKAGPNFCCASVARRELSPLCPPMPPRSVTHFIKFLLKKFDRRPLQWRNSCTIHGPIPLFSTKTIFCKSPRCVDVKELSWLRPYRPTSRNF